MDLTDKKTLQVSISPIDLLHLHKLCRFQIRQAYGDALHLTASRRSNFSAIAFLQNTEIFRHPILFSSSAWGSGGDSRGKRGRLGYTPPFPPPHPRAGCRLRGVSPTGSRRGRGRPARQGGRRRRAAVVVNRPHNASALATRILTVARIIKIQTTPEKN